MQKLNSTDLRKPRDHANWVLMQVEEDPDFILNVLWSNDAHCD